MKQRSLPPRRRALATTSLLCLLGLATACSSSSTESVASRRASIAGGTADTQHENVFLLGLRTEQFGAICTSTLIAPNLLLTARHCVSPGTGEDHVLCGDSVLGEPYPPSSFFATNDARPGESSPFFRAAEVRVPSQNVDTCGYDIALVILEENVPATLSSPAVPRIDRDVTPGEKYTAVGYGVNEDGDPNHSRMQLTGLSVECEPGTCGEGVESTEFRGETGICSGDSGGPALDADGKVVGVVSRGGPGCSTPVYGTVTAWSDFLIQTAVDAAKLGRYEAPFWVTTRSSDPPFVGGSGDGGAGGAPEVPETPAEPELASEGEPCAHARECEAGLVCFGTGHEGTCTASCSETTDCRAGQVCEDSGDVSVCLTPVGSADESSGCSVVGAGAGSSGGAAASLALAGLALLVTTRRRARA
jgi:MYXO-CTERM domain-containing protein